MRGSSPTSALPPAAHIASVRVAQVIRPAAGGMVSHVRTLVKGLQTAGISNEIYASPDTLSAFQHLEAPGHPVRIGTSTGQVLDLVSAVRLGRSLRGHVDLIHAHGLKGALFGIVAGKVAGIPSVFTAHNLIPAMPRWSRALLRAVARQAIGAIAVSGAVSDGLIGLGLDRQRVHIIPNGIDPSPFQQDYPISNVRASAQLPASGPLVLAVGRLAPEKGFDLLLHGFEIAARACPEACLALVGRGPEEGRLRSIAADMKNRGAPGADHIYLMGAVAEVAPLMAAAQLIVVPSRQEGQGIVAIEAMAAGKAVVASRIGGLVETVADGQSGLLTPVEDVPALCQAMLQLLTDDAMARRMGRAGRIIALRDFTAERMTAKTADLYRNLLFKRTSAGIHVSTGT